VLRSWAKDTEHEFKAALERTQPAGTAEWRAANEVRIGDALSALTPSSLREVGVIYADPPYTRDHYSRYYHVYETMYLYDFPDARGHGRTRSDGFVSGFSTKSGVIAAFNALFRNAAVSRLPMAISYPSNGLLQQAGGAIVPVAEAHGFDIERREIEVEHSTLGASKGSSRKAATEELYLCRPS